MYVLLLSCIFVGLAIYHFGFGGRVFGSDCVGSWSSGHCSLPPCFFFLSCVCVCVCVCVLVNSIIIIWKAQGVPQ